MQEADIANLALSHIANEAGIESIDPVDGSVEAGHVGRFYPMARDTLLQMHPWSFAVRRAELTQVDGALYPEWGYAFALPPECLRPLSSMADGAPSATFAGMGDDRGHPFSIESADDGTGVLLCNAPINVLRYITRVVDVSKYSPTFIRALARLLAADLAGPIIKGDVGARVSEKFTQMFMTVEYPLAAKLDANSMRSDIRQTFIPTHLRSRTFTQPWMTR